MDNDVKSRNDMLEPGPQRPPARLPSLPPAGKVLREIGFTVLLLAVIGSVTASFLMGRCSEMLYGMTLGSVVIMIASLQSGRGVDVSALESLVFRR
jgi:hypothetical protein